MMHYFLNEYDGVVLFPLFSILFDNNIVVYILENFINRTPLISLTNQFVFSTPVLGSHVNNLLMFFSLLSDARSQLQWNNFSNYFKLKDHQQIVLKQFLSLSTLWFI